MAMMKRVLPGIVLSILFAGLFLVGYWSGHRSAGRGGAETKRPVLYYVDPMNPAHTSSEPGLAPCGMKMEPVYADDDQSRGESGKNPALSTGNIRISLEKQQIIGVRTETVEQTPFTHTLRTLGRVVPDEDRTYRLSTITDGIVRSLLNSSTGSLVMKDEAIASFFSREFLSAQQGYFYALNTFDRLQPSEDEPDPDYPQQKQAFSNSQLQSAIENLETLGMAKQQIEELARTRQYTREIFIYAPATSLVLQRNISPGQRIEKNSDLFRLADLSHVWVLADMFESEAGFISPGSAVRVRLPLQGKVFEASISEVPPQFDPVSRTLKIRLDVDNPDFILRPDMFVDVEVMAALPPAVSVPADAVIDSGTRRVVYVDLGNGYFEPRSVETGWRLSGRIQIVEGLSPGEKIVVAGNFLLDSESRMKLARAGLSGKLGKCPSCGMEVAEGKAKAEGRTVDLDGKTFYFCSNECVTQFKNEKDKTAKPPSVSPDTGHHGHSHPAGEKVSSVRGEKKFDYCPVCSMTVVVSKAKALERQLEYLGNTYYFCSNTCKKRFAAHPGPFLAGKHSPGSPPVTDAPMSQGPGQAAGQTEPDHSISTMPPSVPMKDNAVRPAAPLGAAPSEDHSLSTGERDASEHNAADANSAHGGSLGMSAPAKKQAEFDLKKIW
ncbi:MAG: efflux RND transporter periplasmic adaptor subunit [Syntrophobacteraceae bacterium]